MTVPVPAFHKDDYVVLRIHPDTDPWGWRNLTADERAAWYASDDSKGMDSAGESKLPPRDVAIRLEPLRPYIVVKGRCAPNRGWGRSVLNCCQVTDPTSGETFFVERRNLMLLSEEVHVQVEGKTE